MLERSSVSPTKGPIHESQCDSAILLGALGLGYFCSRDKAAAGPLSRSASNQLPGACSHAHGGGLRTGIGHRERRPGV